MVGFTEQGLRLALGSGLVFSEADNNHDPEKEARETASTLKSTFNEATHIERERAYWSINTRMRPGVTREDFLDSTRSVGSFVQMQRYNQDGFFFSQDTADRMLDSLARGRRITRSTRDEIKSGDWKDVSDGQISRLYREIEGEVTGVFWTRVEDSVRNLTDDGLTGEDARRHVCKRLFSDMSYFSIQRENGDDTLFCKIPGNNFNFQKISEFIRERSDLTDNLEYMSAPGTSKEWALLITAHEFEHAAGHGQAIIHDQASQFFEDVRARAEANPDDAQAQIVADYFHFSGNRDRFETQVIEIEADLAAVHITRDIISPEVHEYWAALRIADASQDNMREALNQAWDNENGQDFYLCSIRDDHDTGFFIDHYLQTGEMPDYFEMQTNVSGFYFNTAQFMRDETRAEMEQRGLAEGFDALDRYAIDAPTAAQVVSVVQQALQADPPVYTPEEEIIASRYVENIAGQHGIKPEPLFTNEYYEQIQDQSKSKLDQLNDAKAEAEVKAAPDQTQDHQEAVQPLTPGA